MLLMTETSADFLLNLARIKTKAYGRTVIWRPEYAQMFVEIDISNMVGLSQFILNWSQVSHAPDQQKVAGTNLVDLYLIHTNALIGTHTCICQVLISWVHT